MAKTPGKSRLNLIAPSSVTDDRKTGVHVFTFCTQTLAKQRQKALIFSCLKFTILKICTFFANFVNRCIGFVLKIR